MLPVETVVLRDGDEIVAEEDAGDALDVEQASGQRRRHRAALSASRKSAVPSGSTSLPGKNFNVAGFGVASVWMNMAILRWPTAIL